MNMKYIKLFFIVFVIFTCAIGTISIFNGCATIQDNGLKGLLAAKSEISSLADQYETIYQRASQTAKDKWKMEIDPYFLEADIILMEWELLINTNQDTTDVYNRYLLLKDVLIKTIVEIEEG